MNEELKKPLNKAINFPSLQTWHLRSSSFILTRSFQQSWLLPLIVMTSFPTVLSACIQLLFHTEQTRQSSRMVMLCSLFSGFQQLCFHLKKKLSWKCVITRSPQITMLPKTSLTYERNSHRTFFKETFLPLPSST